MSHGITRLGILAGGGEEPAQFARMCVEARLPIVLIGLKGYAEPVHFSDLPHDVVGLGQLKTFLKLLKPASHVSFIGEINEMPNIANVRMDTKAMMTAPRFMKAMSGGRDTMRDFAYSYAADQGLTIISPKKVKIALGVE